MALTVRRISDTAIEVTGYRPADADRVYARAKAAGRAMQDKIADDFESEYAGGKSLRTNTDRYDDRKIMAGNDPRLGHRTGRLQRALWKPGLVKVQKQPGRIVWTLMRGLLLTRVPYSDYYAENKVRGGNLLAVYPALVEEARSAMRGVRLTQPDAEPRFSPGRRSLSKFERIAEALGAMFGSAA